MAIIALPTRNRVQAGGNTNIANPSDARRKGELLAGVGSSITNFASALSTLNRSAKDGELALAIKEAKLVAAENIARMQADVRIEAEQTDKDILSIYLENVKGKNREHLEKANPEYRRALEIAMNEVTVDKMQPFVAQATKSRYESAKQKIMESYIDTENRLAENPTLLTTALDTLQQTVDANPYIDEAKKESFGKNVAKNYIKASAIAYAREGNSDSINKAEELVSKYSSMYGISSEESAKIRDVVTTEYNNALGRRSRELTVDRAETALRVKNQQEQAEIAILTKSRTMDGIAAQEQVHSELLTQVVNGNVEVEAYKNLISQDTLKNNFDRSGDYQISKMFAAGVAKDDIRNFVTRAAANKSISLEKATQWNKMLQDYNPNRYPDMASARELINIVMKDEPSFAVMDEKRQERERAMKANVISTFVSLLNTGKYPTAVEAAKLAIASVKRTVGITPYASPSEQLISEVDKQGKLSLTTAGTDIEKGTPLSYQGQLHRLKAQYNSGMINQEQYENAIRAVEDQRRAFSNDAVRRAMEDIQYIDDKVLQEAILRKTQYESGFYGPEAQSKIP